MSLEAQDSHTTGTTRRILILLFIVILVQANRHIGLLVAKFQSVG